MPIARITSIGGDLYHVHVVEATDPGFGHPGRPVDPGWGAGHPGFHPGHDLPGGGLHPGNRPPGSFPGYPGNALPGSPGTPGNELPSVPPPTLMPGWTLVLVRTPDGKWHYASAAPGAPVQPLPEPIPPGGKPDQGLPPQPGVPTQPLPPTAAPKPA